MLRVCTILSLIILTSCSQDNSIPKPEKTTNIFAMASPDKTGINFNNHLKESDSLNYFTYSYIYMGGGIATGDINNDGLVDIYFTGNQVSNKLYLNKGNLMFEDITNQAGVAGDNRWYTGVTMADVNNDGFLDIYCSVGGKFSPKNNQLFINNQDGTFFEKAAEYGLDDAGNSVQATFFDYDKDGDLDVYVANYPPTKFNSPNFVYQRKMQDFTELESDHLYSNVGDKFEDVTEPAGLSSFGLSLSATVGDLNNDGWPDLYVSNDFNSPDYLYINQKNGSFNEVVKTSTSHTAFYGMGVDIADFNNDGYLDIFQVDMDAANHRRQKANMASMNPDLFWSVVNAGFHYQYMQNCLQVNSGVIDDHGNTYFSNLSRITGTSSTDWSWGPLFADFDNDGLKDLFITNGTRREINNNDFFNQLKSIEVTQDTLLGLSEHIPSEKIDNFIFKNMGDLDFVRKNESWGIEYEGFSNGVAYADLDNDGDLEIITNNIDDEASIFENKSAAIYNYLKVAFTGLDGNKFGLGARVYITTTNGMQMQELTLTRGFQSAVAPELHFGLSNLTVINELKVIWPDGKQEVRENVAVNEKLVLDYADAKAINKVITEDKKAFENSVDFNFPYHRHVENEYDDYKDQVLLPHKMSRTGPAIAVGDFNGDGLEDFFIGGASKSVATIYVQSKQGFDRHISDVFMQDIEFEDVSATVFDADGDGDQDIYVVSGGYEFPSNSKLLQDRLYVNDGTGNFSNASLPLPNTSGSKALTLDFDQDGDDDLLVLGRQVPGNYPMPANTHLLRNESENGLPIFRDYFNGEPNLFENLGMATSAIVTDFNNDTWPDIIIVGEWMPISVFVNEGGIFNELTQQLGLNEKTVGWWWSINQGDFDGDGDQDYIVGNNGLNYKYQAAEDETFDIFAKDFDNNKTSDIVLGYYEKGRQYPVRGRECSSQQIPGIKDKFKNYETYANASLGDIYSKQALASALHYKVHSFASVYLENDEGKFVIHELPREAQVSSINQIIIEDYNQDGNPDALVAGNLLQSEVETPRNDAGHGLLLVGDGSGGFAVKKSNETGFFAPGNVKDMVEIKVLDDQYLIVAKNDEALQYIKLTHLK